jgi:hypothetical protein
MWFRGRRATRSEINARVEDALGSLPKADRKEAAQVMLALLRITRTAYAQEEARWGVKNAKAFIRRPHWGVQEIAEASLGERRHRRTRNLLHKLRETGVVVMKSEETSESRLKKYSWGRDFISTRDVHLCVWWGLDPQIAAFIVSSKPEGGAS